MTKLQAIREFVALALGEQKVVIARDKFDDGNYAMDIDNNYPRVKLPDNLGAEMDEGDRIFRKDFIERCPMAKGFANITLTLLHECGHWATRSVFDCIEYDRMVKEAYCQTMYMAIPWEHLATEWAICWLYTPINRKIAKAFERNYFNQRGAK